MQETIHLIILFNHVFILNTYLYFSQMMLKTILYNHSPLIFIKQLKVSTQLNLQNKLQNNHKRND